MINKHYIPEKGDIVWIDFDPSAGKEIQKRRPGVVVSRYDFNRATFFAVICPITSTVNNNRIQFTLPKENKISYNEFESKVTSGEIVVKEVYIQNNSLLYTYLNNIVNEY